MSAHQIKNKDYIGGDGDDDDADADDDDDDDYDDGDEEKEGEGEEEEEEEEEEEKVDEEKEEKLLQGSQILKDPTRPNTASKAMANLLIMPPHSNINHTLLLVIRYLDRALDSLDIFSA
ncbi:LOW QUALITY PROTEIN: hypothetical protein PoB_001824500 [Plakobranchus ocellatus]|uniref:Uncharacterized protein n=1 Tax=Plakobranchus ocellatus TaxID=259542 RepID=A0AAV3Z997_9GAST|nr:LOW QUALITY PROTEIN: hypothetical protein PoB_001824500 [Plakobranchus ocellatus]